MADVYTDRLGLIAQEEGQHTNEWGDLLNLNLQRLDSATRGYIAIVLTTDKVLDATDLSTTSTTAQENSFFKFLEFTGTPGASIVTVPAEDIVWTVYNNTDGIITFTPAGGTGVAVPIGEVHTLIYGSNGTTMVDVTNTMVSNTIISGQTELAATPDDTDELLISDAGTLKRIDASYITFASGTSMLFRQTAAPTGWTKNTSFDNHCLKVETGTATSGGTVDFSTFLADVLTGSTAISEAQMPSHTHTGPSHTHTGTTDSDGSHNHNYKVATGDSSSGAIQNATNNGAFGATYGLLQAGGAHTHTFTTAGDGTGATGSKGSDSGHTHSLAQDIKYVDIIIAEKD
jgi:hypothetical protein